MFDRQRHAVEKATQLTDGGDLLGALVIRRVRVPRSLEEQPDRRRRRHVLERGVDRGRVQRHQRTDRLADDADRHTRGRQHAKARAGREQRFDHRRDLGHDVLTVVEHEEQLAAAQICLQERHRALRPMLVARSHLEVRGDLGRDELGARRRRKVDEPNAVVVAIHKFLRHGERDACLPAPTGTGDRDQP